MQVVAGLTFSCAIAVDQTVHCWGGMSGQIPGLFKQITAPSDGFSACGIYIDGRATCWGDQGLVHKVPRGVNLLQISCSSFHCCALDEEGESWQILYIAIL